MLLMSLSQSWPRATCGELSIEYDGEMMEFRRELDKLEASGAGRCWGYNEFLKSDVPAGVAVGDIDVHLGIEHLRCELGLGE